jgi:uncharacterized surface protein with fasciclin (FAS1) repeats
MDRSPDWAKPITLGQKLGMKISGLIISAAVGSLVLTLRAQDAAPQAVDLYSGETQPKATVAPPPEPNGPDLPAVSQLDEAFKRRSLGKKGDEQQLHIEWRQLKNQVANDPAVRAAKAATHTVRTDLEKRKRLRDYYNIYYERMSALAATPEMKLALEALKSLHIGATTQPKVRHSTDASLPNLSKLIGADAKPNAKSATRPDVLQLATASLQPQPKAEAPPNVSMSAALDIIQQAPPELPKPDADIVVTAEKTGQLNTFLKYLNLLGKSALLKGNGPYTVFAPSDKACAEATAKSSMSPPAIGKFSSKAEMTEAAWKRLSYYIINGALTSDKLITTSAPTLNGASLDIKVANGQITVNDAHVIKADVRASNGVIHIIDKVLIPPGG